MTLFDQVVIQVDAKSVLTYETLPSGGRTEIENIKAAHFVTL